eukprot:TRINITY_DN5680_c0_g1_i1.p1 TRINITY_DN5680_c0_g1~~TRINITY_DN5680_c0_g1_i1.p1  ORF type:complete len:346 (-),score=43.71 TRINITY_DN5680_c0_g1_i1:80-1117(-)
MLIKKAIKVAIAFSFTIVYSVLYAILNVVSGSARQRREALAAKVEELNNNAVRDLGCDAKSKKIFIPSTNINLHVVEGGPSDGKLVILIHGFPENWAAWSAIFPSLVERGYFVVAIDMRGYNLSDKPSGVKNYDTKLLSDDILGVIKHYQRVQAHAILAHDWGGAVAYTFASTYPQLLKKLVIMNAPHPVIWLRNIFHNGVQFLSSWYVFYFLIPFLPESFYLYNTEKTLAGMFKLTKKEFPKKNLELMASGIVQSGSITGMLNYYRSFFWGYIFGRHFTGKENYDILCPTLVVWGENDIALTKITADSREFCKDFSLKYIPNCTHFILEDAPEVVLKNVIPFLE